MNDEITNLRVSTLGTTLHLRERAESLMGGGEGGKGNEHERSTTGMDPLPSLKLLTKREQRMETE